MSLPGTPESRFVSVKSAFAADGFDVVPVAEPGKTGVTREWLLRSGRIAVAATHRSATNFVTGEAKRAYYVEGDADTMGWFIGYLCEPEIARMTGPFLDAIVFSFLHKESIEEGPLGPELIKLLRRLAHEVVDVTKPDIPPEYHRELEAMHRGCHDRRPASSVTLDDLWVLNVGIDGVLSHIYTGEVFTRRGHHPRHLRIPLMCNGFAAPGEGGKRWFGRDFMFPTANVYQDTACMIIHRCDDGRRPFVSQTAPGIIGSMVGLNEAGLSMGVDMSPGAQCDPGRPGFNSLLLVRHCVERGSTAAEAVDIIDGAQRGVSWIYPLADASGGAFVVEAGRKLGRRRRLPLMKGIPLHYRRRLPSRRYVKRLREACYPGALRDGLVALDPNWRLPPEYTRDWNEGLWKARDRDLLDKALVALGDLGAILGDLLHFRFVGLARRIRKDFEELVEALPYSPAYFLTAGRINASWKDRHLPGPFYFAPQRFELPRTDGLVVATNHCLSPEMRLRAMTMWNALLAGANFDDIQWRYDELAGQLRAALGSNTSGLGEHEAWRIINFLTSEPANPFHEYYNPGNAIPWQKVQVGGSVSLCELTGRSMKSLFGYYGDSPVTISLMKYLS
ncbi:MAG TPA: carcinine hydrolase/isopenicillin-N N-acyltransferase family protein [Rectinemataceae bacterium]|nr:carcinine hydrolase/isopenicillin-N N-acyltransferase family protein [Rectinemataceae bacterium]